MTHLIKFYLPYVRHHLHVCSVNTFASGSHPQHTPCCACPIGVPLFVFALTTAPLWVDPTICRNNNEPILLFIFYDFLCIFCTKQKNVLFRPNNRYRYIHIWCIHIVNQRARYTRNYESQIVAWSMMMNLFFENNWIRYHFKR